MASRPDKSAFDAILGQERAVRFLESLARGERMPSALIFSGPEGCGRLASARALAYALSCESRTGCGRCAACRANDFGEGYGVIDIAALLREEKNKVAILRRELAAHALAHSLRRYLAIIDHADLMSDEMRATMLKAVEEPPERVSYVLLVSSLGRLSATLRSRAVVVRFAPLAAPVLERLMPGAKEKELLAYAGGSLAAAARLQSGPGSLAELRMSFLALSDRKNTTRQEILEEMRLLVPVLARAFPSWREPLLDLDRAVAENALIKLAFENFAAQVGEAGNP